MMILSESLPSARKFSTHLAVHQTVENRHQKSLNVDSITKYLKNFISFGKIPEKRRKAGRKRAERLLPLHWVHQRRAWYSKRCSGHRTEVPVPTSTWPISCRDEQINQPTIVFTLCAPRCSKAGVQGHAGHINGEAFVRQDHITKVIMIVRSACS